MTQPQKVKNNNNYKENESVFASVPWVYTIKWQQENFFYGTVMAFDPVSYDNEVLV